MSPSRRLVLASTSRYRRELLQRLRVPFESVAPHVDETPRAGEAPMDRAVRLAAAKAHAVAESLAVAANLAGSEAAALVIGSDQVASLAGEVLRKPGELTRARRQLAQLAGQSARFDTAVAVLDMHTGTLRQHLDTTLVQFRFFDAATIDRYLRAEDALDCAGGFKVEGLGIALMQQLESSDPTALIGLPLIWTAGALRDAGWPLP